MQCVAKTASYVRHANTFTFLKYHVTRFVSICFDVVVLAIVLCMDCVNDLEQGCWDVPPELETRAYR